MLRSAVIYLFTLVMLVACGEEKSGSAPELGAANSAATASELRVGIVYSDASAAHYYDQFVYNQIFTMAQSQAVQAGLPYDLLTEADLTNAALVSSYPVLIIPSMNNVQGQNRNAIETALLQAQQTGTAIIGSGELMSSDENAQAFQDSGKVVRSVFGLSATEYLNGVPAKIKVDRNDHAITQQFTPNTKLTEYEQIWFAHFEPVDAEPRTRVAKATINNEVYTAVQARDGSAPSVHFSNADFMADTQLLWRAIQWAGFRGRPAISLMLSRQDSIFLARNDMDQAMIAAELPQTEIPLLDIITDWKDRYNFVSSYYIDIGNNQAGGQYTDWSISAPLYQSYMALGNEMGTHSWTHPHHTSQLTDTELEFEFNQSKNEISTRLQVPVTGGAVPGNPETLRVVENLNQWFDYFSGRSSRLGSNYRDSFGFLEPHHEMFYFSLNTTPDFALIDFLGHTPAQSKSIWRKEIDDRLEHANLPVVHWLWHDYGPTTSTVEGTYSYEMFDSTLDYAYQLGSEFTTLVDFQTRQRRFTDADFSTGFNGNYQVSVNASGVGQFALKMPSGVNIGSVSDWYAYSATKVFMADSGGVFDIAAANSPDPVTRISNLPMRARLLSVTGDGNSLQFSFEGEGIVEVTLSPQMQGNVTVNGADSLVEDQNKLELTFDSIATHTVSVSPIAAVNNPPAASSLSLSTASSQPVAIALSGQDPEGDTLSYSLVSSPANGTLDGTGANIIYQSNSAFEGTDSFSYRVNDGISDSPVTTVQIVVTAPPPPNEKPVANAAGLEMLVNQAMVLELSGSDTENDALTFQVVTQPANGVLSGTAPSLHYQPATGFTGIDYLEFTVSDGIHTSPVARIDLDVKIQISPEDGAVSNELATAPALDGSLSEWVAITPLGEDPDDSAGVNNKIDWQTAYMAHDETNYYIAYRLFDSHELTWGHQIYLDTDQNTSSGFKGFSNEFPIGADYLLEGNVLLKYAGNNQYNWSWQFVGQVLNARAGRNAELGIPRNLFDNSTDIDLFFYGNSSATAGDAVDIFPDAATQQSANLQSRKFSYTAQINNTITNSAPVAYGQMLSGTSDTAIPIVLQGFDIDADPLSFEVKSSPASGTLSGSAENLLYTPNANFTGSDAFSFSINDGTVDSNTGRISLTINNAPTIDNIPVANAQSLNVQAGVATTIELFATDAEGDLLTYSITTYPANGTLTGQLPNIIYTANGNYAGNDSFSFKVNDGTSDSQIAVIAIDVSAVTPPNTVPVANSQNISIAFETVLSVQLGGSDSDADPLTYTLTSLPTHGTLSGTAPTLQYTPDNSFQGTDSFFFMANDGNANSTPALVTITVEAPVQTNQPPAAVGQSLSTAVNQPVSLVLAGIDAENSALTFQLVSQPNGGTLSGTAPNLVYQPNNSFSGLDSFSFNVSDGSLTSNTAEVSINVGQAISLNVSNPNANIVVDGNFADWTGFSPYPNDSDDITGPSNPIDWLEFSLAHNNTDLFVTYRNDGELSLSWGNAIFLDADEKTTTGFAGFSGEFPIGADYLLEGQHLYGYTGTGDNWSWTYVGLATAAVTGDRAEMAIPRAWFGNTASLKLYLRGSSEPFGGTGIDHYPDAALVETADPVTRSLIYLFSP